MKQTLDHNPFLANRPAEERGGVEKLENIEWQTRAAPPTDFENRLGDALERIFGRGIEALPELIAELNTIGMQDPSGKPWSEASLQDYMKTAGR